MNYNHEGFLNTLRQGKNNFAVREIDPLTVVVARTEDDGDGDISYLGEWTDKFEEFVIDRREGIFYGGWRGWLRTYKDNGLYSEAKLMKLAQEECDIAFDWEGRDEVFNFDYEVNETNSEVYVSVQGYEVLARDIPCHGYNHNSMRYWNPSENHNPPGAHWGHVPEDVIKNVTDKYGSVEKADIAYMLEDHKQAERYAANEWGFVCVDLTVYYRGIKIGESSLCGVDGEEDEYIQETISEMIDELDLDKLRQAKLAELSEKLEALR